MKRHAEQQGAFVDLFDGAKAEFKTPEQATNFLKLIASGFSQSDRVLVLPQQSPPGHAAFVFKARAHDEYMIVHQRGDDASLVRVTADEMRHPDPETFEEIREFFGGCDAPVQPSGPVTPASETNEAALPTAADGGPQFIAALKDGAITFKPVGLSISGEKAGRTALKQIAFALLGTYVDPRQIHNEIADLTFIHASGPLYAVLMPDPADGLLLGIGSWSELASDVPDAAKELQRMIRTAMADGNKAH